MAEKGESSDEEPSIAEEVVVTKYKMAGEIANRKSLQISERVLDCSSVLNGEIGTRVIKLCRPLGLALPFPLLFLSVCPLTLPHVITGVRQTVCCLHKVP